MPRWCRCWGPFPDGAVLQVAERRKRATCPELPQGGGQFLCVLGCEIGGRWNVPAMSPVWRCTPAGPHQPCTAPPMQCSLGGTLVERALQGSAAGDRPHGTEPSNCCARSWVPGVDEVLALAPADPVSHPKTGPRSRSRLRQREKVREKAAVATCLGSLVHSADQLPAAAVQASQFALGFGGLQLRSATADHCGVGRGGPTPPTPSPHPAVGLPLDTPRFF